MTRSRHEHQTKLYGISPSIDDDRPYPNEALTDICRQLLDEWELSPEQIGKLASDIAGECQSITDNRAEEAWCDRQERLMETGGTDDTSYRRDMIAAGRGHLVRTIG